MKTATDRLHERIRELEEEVTMWRESCGQNYVRATEAEMREEKLERRIRELEAERDALREECRDSIGEYERLRKALEGANREE